MKPAYYLAAALVAAAVVYLARNSAAQAGAGVVGVVDGALGGAVQEVGSIFGVPKTDLTECERARIEGRTWDASFACPAGAFLKYVFS